VVASGLARGVDAEAHLGAIEARGVTWAVLGSGLAEIYPAEHAGLARRVVACGGAVVSEFPLATRPAPAHFPRRNRIIAGLAAAVVVVEARRASGSLITAEFAMDFGKDVGAVPGPALAPESAGTHALLRDGVVLVEEAIDVFRALDRPWAREAARRAEASASAAARAEAGADDAETSRVLRALGSTPRAADAVAAEVGLPTERVRAALARLEIAGRVRGYPGALYGRARGSP